VLYLQNKIPTVVQGHKIFFTDLLIPLFYYFIGVISHYINILGIYLIVSWLAASLPAANISCIFRTRTS
jgi:hypothetical protein